MTHHPAPVSGLEVASAVWQRRKWIVISVFLCGLCASIVLVRGLPNIYEANASVLVEQPQVAERFVTLASGGLETRLQTITQEVLSRARLNGVIERLGLYPELRSEADPDILAARMRSDVSIRTVEVRRAAGDNATIAFELSYRGRDPQVVADVTNALAELYVERNASIRERQTSGTLDLLQAQLNDVKRKLDEREREMAEFKRRHAGELPEQQVANLAALERLNAQLRLNIDRQLRVLERQDNLAAELTTAPPPPAAPADDLSTQIAELRRELANLRTQLTDEHPDVIRVRSRIAALEAERPRIAAAPSPELQAEMRTRRIRDALRRAEAELNALRGEERAIRGTIASYQQRIENAPRREQDLQRVARDYDTLRELHRSLLQRYQDAQLAERVEERQQGEHFRILDPAVPPRAPVAPSRLMLLMTGLMLASAAGVAAGLLVESRDTSFHSLDDLRAFSTVPVLASVPFIVTEAHTRRQRIRTWLSGAAAAGCIAAVAGAASFVARDNEMLVRLLTPGRF